MKKRSRRPSKLVAKLREYLKRSSTDRKRARKLRDTRKAKIEATYAKFSPWKKRLVRQAMKNDGFSFARAVAWYRHTRRKASK